MNDALDAPLPPGFADEMNISRTVKEFLARFHESAVFSENQSVEEIRRAFAAVQHMPAADFSGIVETKKPIHRDDMDILLNIVRPVGAVGALPVYLFIYGGGWVIGDYPTHIRLVRDLVVLTGFSAVIVDYTPS